MSAVDHREHTVPAGIPEGATIGGKYRLDSLIAEGGMGLVYKGWHLVLDHAVAVKVVRPELAHRADAVSRFLNEARAIAQLRGEHVARVLDSGCIKDGPPYMVLEFLDGADLRTVLESSGPLEVQRAIDLILQACEAMAEAHAAGIVHRDIKPENLFLTRQPDGTECIKVLDFGISKRLDVESRRSYTQQGQSLGSPHYMAPEQMSAPGQVDARADVWSLGVVLFELISGHVPFDGETVPIVCAQVLCKEPLALSTVRPDVPAELEAAVARCLQKTAANRYGSVGEFAEALAPFASPAGAESLLRIQRLLGVEVNMEEPIDLVRPRGEERTPTPRVHATTELDLNVPRGRVWPLPAALAVAAATALGVVNWPLLREASAHAVSSAVTVAENLRNWQRGETTNDAANARAQAVAAPAPAAPPVAVPEPTAAMTSADVAASVATSVSSPAQPTAPASSPVRISTPARAPQTYAAQPTGRARASTWIASPAHEEEPVDVPVDLPAPAPLETTPAPSSDELIPPYQEPGTAAPESGSSSGGEAAGQNTRASLRYAIDPASLRAAGLRSGPSAD